MSRDAQRITGQATREAAMYAARIKAGPQIQAQYENGLLRAEIQHLCGELAQTRDPKLQYIEVNCAELDREVTLGCTYSPGRPGVHTLRNGDPGYPDEPAEFEVCEVWFNGADIAPALMQSVIDQLEQAGIEAMEEAARDARDDYEIGRFLDAREAA